MNAKQHSPDVLPWAALSERVDAQAREHRVLCEGLSHSIDGLRSEVHGIDVRIAELEKPKYSLLISFAGLMLAVLSAATVPTCSRLAALEKSDKDFAEKLATHAALPVHPVAAENIKHLEKQQDDEHATIIGLSRHLEDTIDQINKGDTPVGKRVDVLESRVQTLAERVLLQDKQQH